MNHIHRARRLAGRLAALAGGLLALATAAPVALAVVTPPRSGVAPRRPVPVHTLVAGGMPGWQITLIAIGAAAAGAAAAVLIDRARVARRHLAAPTT